MAAKKSAFAKAQNSFIKSLRNFEKTVAGLVSSPEPKSSAKKKTKRKAKARKGVRKGK